MPPDDNFDADLINSVVDQQMGVTPQTQQQQAPQQPPAPKPTAQEQATAQVSPKTEGTQSKAEPFEFFDAGNGKVYTPEQLRGITSRYSDMNYKHQTEFAPNAKSVNFLNQLRAQAAAEGHTLDDDQMSQMLEAALTAFASNPVIGNKGQQAPTNGNPARQDVPVQTQTGTATDMEAQLQQWEQQNAVSLPPMYKDAIAKTGSLEQQIAQLTQMVQGLTKQGTQIATDAEGKLKQAQQANSDAGRQQVVNNLNRIQTEFQFPDEAEQDFMAFVQGRGYDVWELMDYNLAKTLATDFKNNQQAPDLERFRAMAQKRQAFTGNLAPSPGNAPAAQTPPTAAESDQQVIDGMVDTIMEKRFMK